MKSPLNKYYVLPVLFTFAIVFGGCEKNRVNDEGSPILFGMDGIEVYTKSALTQNDIDARTVYVFGTRNNSETIFSGTGITRSSTGIWFPPQSQIKSWDSGQYTFRAVACSEEIYPISTSSTPPTTSSPGIEAFNSGLSIKVNQPTDYDESEMIDYLLSRTYNVADGNSKPIVGIQLEHAMPAVEIYVIKSSKLNEALIKTISLTGFFTSGTMTCNSPIEYGKTGTNPWSVTPSGGKTVVYSLTGNNTDNKVTIGNDAASTNAKMKIIAIPQQLSSDAALTINYWVNERSSDDDPDNYVEYTMTTPFRLYNYDPQSWQAGHKVIYTLLVDTGIHLTGTIVPWKDVDFIEGTILPDID